jgi:hypothetical protein
MGLEQNLVGSSKGRGAQPVRCTTASGNLSSLTAQAVVNQSRVPTQADQRGAFMATKTRRPGERGLVQVSQSLSLARKMA